jgi:adenine-specific DNA-methyltransferase
MSKKQSIKKKVNYEAPNIFAERIEEFKSIFPEVLTEGRIDLEKLKTALGEETDGKPERYFFSWAGKKDAIRLLQVPSRASLVPSKDESVDFDTTQNIFIEGDNLGLTGQFPNSCLRRRI